VIIATSLRDPAIIVALMQACPSMAHFRQAAMPDIRYDAPLV
jgi:hypothetical protein